MLRPIQRIFRTILASSSAAIVSSILFCSAIVFSSAILFPNAALASNDQDVNIRLNPLGLIVGAYGLDVDFKVSHDWTLGPSALYWAFKLSSDGAFQSDYSVTAYALGARANWMSNGAFEDGFYIGPSLNYINVKVSNTDSLGTVSGSVSGLEAQVLFGYGWFWTNFNILLGGGVSTLLGASKVTVTDESGNQTQVGDLSHLTGLALEFSLGWAF